MPSNSLQTWATIRAADLTDFEAALPRGSTGVGRRGTKQQFVRSYALLLSSQFQGFCRDLHTECIDHLVRAATPIGWRGTLRIVFHWNRRLDSGNPTPGNLGSDFGRLGALFWPEANTADPRTPARRRAGFCWRI